LVRWFLPRINESSNEIPVKMELQHPVYGAYTPGWKPCRDIHQLFTQYEVNEQCQVRNKNTGKVLSANNQQRVKLRQDGQTFARRAYQLALYSFFPHIPHGETVDHIDENHNNSVLCNLQWMSRSDQTKKSNKLKPRNNGPAQSKPVQQLSRDGGLIATFASANEASRKLGISPAGISGCVRGRCPTFKGFKWRYISQPSQEDLEGEEWRTSEWLRKELKSRAKLSDRAIAKIRVSNLGRVLTSQGIKTKGGTQLEIPKYRFVRGSITMHQLVWWAFHDEPTDTSQKDLVICHDDTEPLDEDGCYTNALHTLRLDTQSNNIKESHAVGDLSRARAKKRQRIN